ncbi:hypothetical protein Tco_1006390 [Tanacetum coccineum]|uniref:Uncharacterized protein n=1 Tax=Tanacetum coccineum TaxID=301880 RepID=A0ABQ5FJY2_9ASTR
MSADSAVTYHFCYSLEVDLGSWSRGHVPVYIPEPEHPEDLVPAEDEAPTPLLPSSFLSPRIRPLSPRALEVEMRDVASALYHSLQHQRTQPLLTLPAPSIAAKDDIPEADTPPTERILLRTPLQTYMEQLEILKGGDDALKYGQHGVSYQEDSSQYERVLSFTHEHQRCLQTDRASCESWHFEEYESTVLEMKARPRLDSGSVRIQMILLFRSVSFIWVTPSSGRGLNALLESDVPGFHRSANPLYLKRHEGVVELSQWFERMETVFRSIRQLLGGKTADQIGYLILEAELWNLKVIGNDVVKSTNVFQELHYCVLEIVPAEGKIIEKEAIEMATELMDKRVSTIAERQAENKRKLENTSRNNRTNNNNKTRDKNSEWAYTAGSVDKKPYGGSRPLCSSAILPP